MFSLCKSRIKNVGVRLHGIPLQNNNSEKVDCQLYAKRQKKGAGS